MLFFPGFSFLSYGFLFLGYGLNLGLPFHQSLSLSLFFELLSTSAMF